KIMRLNDVGTTFRRIGLTIAVAAALIAHSAEGAAQTEGGGSAEQPDFAKLVSQGLELYQAAKYEEAIASFRAAVAIKPDPKLLYNIARSYEKLGRVDESIDAYQKFVDSPGTTAQERAKGLEQIKALRNEKTAREAAKQAENEAPPG